MPREVITIECLEPRKEGKPPSRYQTTRNKKLQTEKAAFLAAEPRYLKTMSSKSATASAGIGRDATIDGYLAEMVSIRRRMKSTDVRIRRADASIRRDLDEAWAILRHVQTVR